MPPSAKGWRASRTLRGITGRHVIEHKASVENGKIDEYRVTMEVTFILENSGTTRQPRLFQLARNGQPGRCSKSGEGPRVRVPLPPALKRVAVSSTGCRPCRIASTSSGQRKVR